MFDAAIIGAGGIVGSAIARELATSGLSVAAIERHTSACQETSGLNSRVIHSGFHERPGTLKSQLARTGSQRMIAYAEERSIPFLRAGMLIAVPRGAIQAGLWRETNSLWNLWRQGRRQNIPFQFIVTPGGIRKIAPIQALGGIFIPSVCVIYLEALVDSLQRDAQAAGTRFFYGSEVRAIRVQHSHYDIQTSNEDVQARVLINSAGLHAHEVSVMAGGPEYQIEFIRGDYYELTGGVARWDIRTLVYPAMPPHSKSKGIHFGPHTDGRLYIGPSATPTTQQAPKELFVEAARKFLPAIRDTDLEWAYAGIRPKHGNDFTIRLDRKVPPLINLIGIDSPGLSGSMGIASHVAEMVNSGSG